MPTQVGDKVIRAFLAGERRLFRHGLGGVLSARPGFELAGESALVDPDDDRLRSADVLVVSDAARQMAALDELGEGGDGPPVLVITSGRSSVGARAALGFGYAGYVSKDATAEEFLDAVRAVASGAGYVDPSIASEPGRPALTPRQFVTLKLLGEGLTNREVAERLGISIRTVHSHRAQVRRKLGISTRADLVRFVTEHQF